jgi:DNA polymerase-3 subunit epsilon
VIDTLQIARRRYPGAQNSLDALCTRYGIDNSRRTKHGALLDSEILAEVYAELTGGRQSSLGLSDFDPGAPGGATAAALASGAGRATIAAIPLITAEEREKHRAFIAEMGEKALWNAYLAPQSEA